MDFLVEFLVETLGEMFLEHGVEAAADSRIPRWLRVLILVCTALIFCAVFGILLIVGVLALLWDSPWWIAPLMFALDGWLAFLLGTKVRKALRKRARK